MAKISFSRVNEVVETPPSGVPTTVNVEVAPAIEIPTAPVTETALVPAGQLQVPELRPEELPWDEERINLNDIYLPRINLVHNVGELMTMFNPGEIVLNASMAIHTPAQPQKKVEGTPPLNLTVVGICRRQFVEKKKQSEGDSERGNLFNTLSEVVAAGGTVDYKEWEHSKKAHFADPRVPELKLYQNYDTALVFIEKPSHVPDEEHLLFPHCYNGRYFVLALWSMKGTAYTNAAKRFYTEKKIGALAKGYATRSWDVTTKLETYRNVASPVWIPVVKIGPSNPVEFITFIKEVLGCANG